jgi:long-subunit acyl-CoA synthetase (AMP-forming)
LIAVPRIYEKIEDAVMHEVRQANSIFQKLFASAMNLGLENTHAQTYKERSPFGFNFMKYFVLNAVKKKLGLDHIE